MNKLVVSVITVCYNAAATIRETIESVLSQNYQEIEYILVDGGSTDTTCDIIRSYTDPRLRFISEKDEGLYDAINKGIQMSGGDILCLLHADDVFASDNTLAMVVSHFETDAELEALSCAVHIYKPGRSDKPYRVYRSDNFKSWQFRLGMQPPHPGFFVSRSGFGKVGYYCTQYRISGDFEWLFRAISLVKLKVKYSCDVAVKMRDGGLSSSGRESKLQLNNEILKILKMHGIYSNKLLVYSKYLIKVFQLRW